MPAWTNKLSVEVHTYHPRYKGSKNRRIAVQASPGIKQDPISK
jgi:hypothetical protein